MDDETQDPEAPAASFYEVLVAATPRFWVTPALVAANVLWFVAGIVLGVSPVDPEGGELIRFGANFGAYTLAGEWWRLLSSAFVHIGFVHLLFNMWCLWSLGNVAERMFGNGVFLSVYVLSALGGSLASLLWRPNIISRVSPSITTASPSSSRAPAREIAPSAPSRRPSSSLRALRTSSTASERCVSTAAS
jgi:membrane associated rhomboid family serine protease